MNLLFSKLALVLVFLALAVPVPASEAMKLSSSAFSDGGKIPAKHTRDSSQRDISPPLSWSGAPEGTKSFALLCIDRHPVARGWVHWVLFNVPAATLALPERMAKKARLPDGVRQGKNSFGEIGWGGPKPPPGTGDHKYVFTLYALDIAELGLRGEPTAGQLGAAMKGHVLAETTLTGIYVR